MIRLGIATAGLSIGCSVAAAFCSIAAITQSDMIGFTGLGVGAVIFIGATLWAVLGDW